MCLERGVVKCVCVFYLYIDSLIIKSKASYMLKLFEQHEASTLSQQSAFCCLYAIIILI